MSSSPATKIGHGLAKVLGIKLQYRNPTGQEDLARGESVYSVSSADTFVEEEPTSLEWISSVAPTSRTFTNWVYHLFPFTHWIGRYNLQWLVGDLIAGTSHLSLGSQSCQLMAICRYHRGSCRRSSVNGIRQIGPASRTVWSILFVHGRLDILVLRHIQGYYHWRQYLTKCPFVMLC